MVNKLIIAISQKLYSLFGTGYDIYSEEVSQKLTPPAFFIQMLQAGSDQLVGSRYKRNNSFDILFFPSADGSELSQCRTVGETLLNGMEYITVTGPPDLLFRGIEMRTETIDGVQHFFVQYNRVVRKETALVDKMGELTQEGFIKG